MRTEGIEDGKDYAALVGFDWADREHAWVLQWSDTGARERGRLEQTPEAVERWLSELMTRLNGRRIAVAIEQKHGAVVWMLLKYVSAALESQQFRRLKEPQKVPVLMSADTTAMAAMSESKLDVARVADCKRQR